MNGIKGPGLYVAQFMREREPFNTLEGIARWAAGMGYTGLQIPADDARLIDLEQAAQSRSYCDEYKGRLKNVGLELAELAGYIYGQMLAIHPAYELLFQPFYPKGFKDRERVVWAAGQLNKVILASANMGTRHISALSGGLAWPLFYPWPQRPAGIIEEAFRELSQRWRPLLDTAHEKGITIGYELHPGSDLYDGATYEMFLEQLNDHPAACLTYDPSHFLLQRLDYLEFIRLYGHRIKAFHVKDAEYLPSGRVGVYGGYQGWLGRAGRFRSPGDGQVDFRRVFSLLAEAGFEGWAILEWECCLKSPEQGAREGAGFIRQHMIEVTQAAFDDFMGTRTDAALNRRILGLE